MINCFWNIRNDFLFRYSLGISVNLITLCFAVFVNIQVLRFTYWLSLLIEGNLAPNDISLLIGHADGHVADAVRTCEIVTVLRSLRRSLCQDDTVIGFLH